MGDWASISKGLSQDTRFFPTIIGVFLSGLLLLFIKDAPPYIRDHVVPAVIVYTLGTALIAYLQTMLAFRREFKLKEGERYTGNHPFAFWTIVALHGAWFIGLVWFLLSRWSQMPTVP